MKKAEWKTEILKACDQAGTNAPYYESVIDTLAEILEVRDIARDEFVAAGSKVTVHTEYRGAEVIKKHPAVAIMYDCNQQALAYWRDLGLTPSGFKKLEGIATRKEEKDAFSELLGGII